MADVVSVVIPVYKVERYLEKCLDSVQKQTYLELQIILVDDGSPDRCPQICENYAAKDSRIQVIHQRNMGLSAARNAGIEKATGEYLFFIDSDDFITPDAIELLLQALCQHDADMAIGNFTWADENGLEIRRERKLVIRDECLTATQALNRLHEPGGEHYEVAWGKVYKRCLFDKIRYPAGKIHEDTFTTYRVLANSKRIACVEKLLYFYTRRKDSIMGIGLKLKTLDVLEALCRQLCFYASSHDPMLRELCPIIEQRLFLQAFDCIERLGYENREANRRMYRMIIPILRCLPLFLLNHEKTLKERIMFVILLLSPKTYGKLIGGRTIAKH